LFLICTINKQKQTIIYSSEAKNTKSFLNL
jgi:hypothetical protein